MMKTPYEELEFEVIRFTVEDIITTSNAQTDDDQEKDQNEGGITYTQIGDTNQYQGSDGNTYFLIDEEYIPAGQVS